MSHFGQARHLWHESGFENEIEQTAMPWGLPVRAVEGLGDSLQQFWERYSRYVRTQTRDTSRYGLSYLSGLLRLNHDRNMAQMSRQLGEDPQDLHHFMSNSPWSARQLISAIQHDVLQHTEFRTEAALIIDESADEKSGTVSAGAGRQHNGRTGQIDECQVGVFLTLATAQVNLWLDGELFIPEAWFTNRMVHRRTKAGIPQDR
jgi:SRSO17 transposase